MKDVKNFNYILCISDIKEHYKQGKGVANALFTAIIRLLNETFIINLGPS